MFAAHAGRPLHASFILVQFRALCARASEPRIRFHDLRHTAATLLLGSRRPPEDRVRDAGPFDDRDHAGYALARHADYAARGRRCDGRGACPLVAGSIIGRCSVPDGSAHGYVSVRWLPRWCSPHVRLGSATRCTRLTSKTQRLRRCVFSRMVRIGHSRSRFRRTDVWKLRSRGRLMRRMAARG